MAMENKVVYKGMKRLRYSDRAEEIKDAVHSPYKLWRDYLRLSKDYWWVCQQKGDTLDADLKAMYEDFGDVYELGFNDWWHQKGRVLFAEQVKPPAVKQIDDDLSNLSPNPQNHLLAEIPLNLTERTISRQLMKIIREHKDRKIERVSHAKRPLAKLVGIRKRVLKTAHDIWCVNHLVQLAKKEGSNIGAPFNKMTTHQMGVGFRLVRNCMPRAGDGIEGGRKKRNGMKVAVSRMLNRADTLIANAEIGKFPSFEKVEPRERWTDAQQKALDTALANNQWMPPAIDIDDFRRMFDNAPKVATSFKMWAD